MKLAQGKSIGDDFSKDETQSLREALKAVLTRLIEEQESQEERSSGHRKRKSSQEKTKSKKKRNAEKSPSHSENERENRHEIITETDTSSLPNDPQADSSELSTEPVPMETEASDVVVPFRALNLDITGQQLVLLVKAMIRPIQSDINQLTSDNRANELLLKKIHNCLMFSGDETISRRHIRALNPRERARWFLEHPGVREYLLRAFFVDPKPGSKDEIWNDIFGHLADPPQRWHLYSSSELNIWFNTKRSTTLRVIQKKFHYTQNWQADLPVFLTALFPEANLSPNFIGWVIQSLNPEKQSQKNAARTVTTPTTLPSEDIDLETTIEDRDDSQVEGDEFQKLLDLASKKD